MVQCIQEWTKYRLSSTNFIWFISEYFVPNQDTVFPNMDHRCLFNFKTLRGGVYWRLAFKSGRRLIQSKKSYS